MQNDGVRHFEIIGRLSAGCDHGVHFDRSAISSSRYGGVESAEVKTIFSCMRRTSRIRMAGSISMLRPGVPYAEGPARRRAPKLRQVAKANVRQRCRKTRSESRNLLAERALDRDQLNDGGGDAGEPFLEVRRNNLDVTDDR